MSDPYAQPSSNPPPQPPLGARPGGTSVSGSGYPQYTGYPPGPEFPRPAASTNGFAVAALVLGILGGLLGFVFGIIALVQIRRTGQKGTGLAVTGLALSALWLLVIGVGVVPTWDAVLLVHARRARILPEEHRAKVFSSRNPHSVPTFLVDGAVAGSWRFVDGRIHLTEFEPRPRGLRRRVEQAARDLAAFHA